MITIAIANQKGGVGKTTTAVTLAHLYARKKYKTLLIDLDPQGNCADCLGMEPGNEAVQLLRPGVNLFLPVEARENLDLLRMDKTGANLKLELAGQFMREYALSRMLEDLDMQYDICLIDCAPSVDLLQVCGIMASQFILVPAKLDQLAVKGVREMLITLKDILEINHGSLAGVLPTMYDRTTKESQLQFENLAKYFRGSLIPPIPTDTKIREAVRHGKTIVEYDPESRSLVGVSAQDDKPLGGYYWAQEVLHETVRY